MNYKFNESRVERNHKSYRVNKHWMIGNVFLVSFGTLMALNSAPVHAADADATPVIKEVKVAANVQTQSKQLKTTTTEDTKKEDQPQLPKSEPTQTQTSSDQAKTPEVKSSSEVSVTKNVTDVDTKKIENNKNLEVAKPDDKKPANIVDNATSDRTAEINKSIDDAVREGKLTADQANQLKAQAKDLKLGDLFTQLAQLQYGITNIYMYPDVGYIKIYTNVPFSQKDIITEIKTSNITWGANDNTKTEYGNGLTYYTVTTANKDNTYNYQHEIGKQASFTIYSNNDSSQTYTYTIPATTHAEVQAKYQQVIDSYVANARQVIQNSLDQHKIDSTQEQLLTQKFNEIVKNTNSTIEKQGKWPIPAPFAPDDYTQSENTYKEYFSKLIDSATQALAKVHTSETTNIDAVKKQNLSDYQKQHFLDDLNNIANAQSTAITNGLTSNQSDQILQKAQADAKTQSEAETTNATNLANAVQTQKTNIANAQSIANNEVGKLNNLTSDQKNLINIDIQSIVDTTTKGPNDTSDQNNLNNLIDLNKVSVLGTKTIADINSWKANGESADALANNVKATLDNIKNDNPGSDISHMPIVQNINGIIPEITKALTGSTTNTPSVAKTTIDNLGKQLNLYNKQYSDNKAVNDYVKQAESAIDNNKTLTPQEKTDAKNAIEQAGNNAIDAINQLNDPTQDIAKADDIVKATEHAIDNIQKIADLPTSETNKTDAYGKTTDHTTDTINGALNSTIDAIKGGNSDAVINGNNLSDSIVNKVSRQALGDVAVKAKQALQNYADGLNKNLPADASKSIADQITPALQKAQSAIDNAVIAAGNDPTKIDALIKNLSTDSTDPNNLVTSGKTALDTALKTGAENAIRQAATNANTFINDKTNLKDLTDKDRTDFTTANTGHVDSTRDTALDEISKATTSDAVKNALKNGLTNIQYVQDEAELKNAQDGDLAKIDQFFKDKLGMKNPNELDFSQPDTKDDQDLNARIEAMYPALSQDETSKLKSDLENALNSARNNITKVAISQGATAEDLQNAITASHTAEQAGEKAISNLLTNATSNSNNDLTADVNNAKNALDKYAKDLENAIPNQGIPDGTKADIITDIEQALTNAKQAIDEAKTSAGTEPTKIAQLINNLKTDSTDPNNLVYSGKTTITSSLRNSLTTAINTEATNVANHINNDLKNLSNNEKQSFADKLTSLQADIKTSVDKLNPTNNNLVSDVTTGVTDIFNKIKKINDSADLLDAQNGDFKKLDTFFKDQLGITNVDKLNFTDPTQDKDLADKIAAKYPAISNTDRATLKTKLENALADARDAITNSQTIDASNTAEKNGEKAITDLLNQAADGNTNALNKDLDDAKQAIDDNAKKAIDNINKLPNLDDKSKEEAINQINDDAKKAKDDVAKENDPTKINQIVSDNDLDNTKTVAKAEVKDEAEKAKKEIDDLTEVPQSDNDKAKSDIDNLVNKADGDIDAAKDKPAINQVVNKTKDDIDKIATNLDLKNAANAAKQALQYYAKGLEDDLKGIDKDATALNIDTKLDDAKQAIDDAVNDAGNDPAKIAELINKLKPNSTDQNNLIASGKKLIDDGLLDDAKAAINKAADDVTKHINGLADLTTDHKDEYLGHVESTRTNALEDLAQDKTPEAIKNTLTKGLNNIKEVKTEADLLNAKDGNLAKIDKFFKDKLGMKNPNELDFTKPNSKDDQDLTARIEAMYPALSDADKDTLKTKLENVLADARNNITNSKTIDATNVAEANGEKAITDLLNQAADGNTNALNKDLDNAKQAIDDNAKKAIDNINKLPNLDPKDKDDIINKIKDEATKAKDDVAKENDPTKVNQIVSDNAKDDAIAELTAHAKDKKAEINNLPNLDGDTKNAVDKRIDDALTKAVDDIKNAKPEEIAQKTDDGKKAIDKAAELTPREKQKINQEIDDNAKKAIGNINKLPNLDPKDKENIIDKIKDEATKAKDDVAKENDPTKINQIVSDNAKNDAKADLKAHAEDKKQGIKDLPEDVQKTIDNRIDKALDDANKTIDDAKTPAEIDNAVVEGKKNIDKAAEVTPHEKQKINQEIDDNAKKAIGNINKLPNLDPKDKENIINKIKDEATKAKDDVAKENDPTKINQIVSDNDLDNTKTVAKAEVKDEAEKAKKEIDDLTEIPRADKDKAKSNIDNIVNKADKDIDAAKDKPSLKPIVDEAKKQIDQIADNLIKKNQDILNQKAAEEAARQAALDNARQDAINKLRKVADDTESKLNNLPFLTDDQKADFNKHVEVEFEKGKRAIQYAPTITDVKNAYDTAEKTILGILAEAEKQNLKIENQAQEKGKTDLDNKFEHEKQEILNGSKLTDAQTSEKIANIEKEYTSRKQALTNAKTPEAMRQAVAGKLPQTGEKTNVFGLIMGMLASILGLFGIGKKREEK